MTKGRAFFHLHWTNRMDKGGPAIEDDYRAWLKQNEDHLTVSKERVEELLRDHE
jgi:hypothetical protein